MASKNRQSNSPDTDAEADAEVSEITSRPIISNSENNATAPRVMFSSSFPLGAPEIVPFRCEAKQACFREVPEPEVESRELKRARSTPQAKNAEVSGDSAPGDAATAPEEVTERNSPTKETERNLPVQETEPAEQPREDRVRERQRRYVRVPASEVFDSYDYPALRGIICVLCIPAPVFTSHWYLLMHFQEVHAEELGLVLPVPPRCNITLARPPTPVVVEEPQLVEEVATEDNSAPEAL